MLGGTIQVESEVGRGTEFTVMLECEISGTTVKEEPDSEQREPLKNEKQKIRAEIQRRYEGKKVLLVEDNELNREIATAIMEEIGLDVDCVEDEMCIRDRDKSPRHSTFPDKYSYDTDLPDFS